MKKITILLITMYAICCAFTSCSRGTVKGCSDTEETDMIDTVTVDTVEEINENDYNGDSIGEYEDDYLSFRYPAEYQCVEDENGAIAIYNKRNRDNYMTFSYHDVRPNENAESAVKKIVINLLQRYPDAVLIKSSNSPIPPENDSMRSIYYAIVRLGEESEPTTYWVSSVLMKNGHLHITTSTSDNEHDANVFNAILRTIIMK